MDGIETRPAGVGMDAEDAPTRSDVASLVRPQVVEADCPTCASSRSGEPHSFVYAIGQVRLMFPSVGVEKELAQAAGRVDGRDLTDSQVQHEVLRANRYLARSCCYVFVVGGLETYLLRPRDPLDLDLLVEAIRPRPTPLDLDVVVGQRGPIAPPEVCNGLMVPVVTVDQLYSFDRDTLRNSIPRPSGIAKERFLATADELLDRILQVADNAGSTDEDRALNYLAVRYDRIYSLTAEAHARNASLTAIEARQAPLSGTRNLVDVVFTYTDRGTDVPEQWFVRVDVTETYPFLLTKAAPYVRR
jgi:hypothetical protein